MSLRRAAASARRALAPGPRIGAVTALLALAAAPAQASCRQALALGLDISGSVDATEYRLQRDGLAEALGRDAVRRALLAGPAPVRLSVYEWSGETDQALLVPWTEVVDAATLDSLRARIRSVPRTAAAPTTALGAAMLYGFDLLEGQVECWQRTLDLSGDGPANTGPRPQDIPDSRTPAGVVVNGLTIGADVPMGRDERAADIRQLSAYYTTYVLRGPGAFVETALGFESYADAMERKLLREITALGLSALQNPDHPDG